MTNAIETPAIRELSLNEIDDVSGAFQISLFGVTLRASASPLSVTVDVEGVGGVSVTGGGIMVKDSKGNINGAPWPT